MAIVKRSALSRRSVFVGSVVVIVAMGLAVWMQAHETRASFYLWRGNPMKAWHAALRMEPGPARDELLRRSMLAPVRVSDGVAPLWEVGKLDVGLYIHRDDPRPSWIFYGPNGQLVEELLESMEGWPWLACGLPPEDLPPEQLDFRFIEFQPNSHARSGVETKAHSIAVQGVQRAHGTGEHASRVANAVGHYAGLVAYGAWDYRGDELTVLSEAVAPLLASGHFPILVEGEGIQCALCDVGR